MKHELYKTSFYNSWDGMKRRATSKINRDYYRYGKIGRGMVSDWVDFFKFKEDMYPSYQEAVKKYPNQRLSLDRIDNDKGYSKENCRWATQYEQNRNKTINRYFAINGEKKVLIDWAKHFNICYVTVAQRIRNGWDIEKAFKTPPTTVNKYTSDRTLPEGVYKRESGNYMVKFRNKNYGTYKTIKEAELEREKAKADYRRVWGKK